MQPSRRAEQVLALKKQIAVSGHQLVREYLDEGFSGLRLDRPALDQMRKHSKTKLLEI